VVSACEDGSEVVLDTNVVFDWLVFADAAARPLAAALETGRLRWVCTPAMLDELAHVLRRGTLQRWCIDVEQVLTLAKASLSLVDAPATPCPLNCRDPDDQKFIDLAWARRTRWLISKDMALLRLAGGARAWGAEVCTPARWAVLTGADAGPGE
jgi:putative PIN family toxin of toxin-antitoxin system